MSHGIDSTTFFSYEFNLLSFLSNFSSQRPAFFSAAVGFNNFLKNIWE